MRLWAILTPQQPPACGFLLRPLFLSQLHLLALAQFGLHDRTATMAGQQKLSQQHSCIKLDMQISYLWW